MSSRFSSIRATWKNSRLFNLDLPDSCAAMSVNFRNRIRKLKVSSAWILVLILKSIGYLPRRITLLLGIVAGWLFYSSNRKRRNIVQKNLEICFPHWPVEKRRYVARQHFRHFGQAILDLGMIWSASKARLNRWVNLNGLDHCLRAQNDGHPIILITPHVIAVDMAAVILSQHIPLCTIMKDLRNPIFNEQVISGRSRFNLKIYKRVGGIGRMVRDLRRKRNCYYIPDEDLGAKNSVFVPFFGVQTATLSTLDRMARLADAVVMPTHAYLDPITGRYNITIKPPLPDFPTEDQQVNARLMNSAFEDIIDAAPEQYMWTLRWFKTRPDNGPPLY